MASVHIGKEYWTRTNTTIEVVISLLEYGAPSHRIEDIVAAIGLAFGIPTAFYYLQNYGIIQFPNPSCSDNLYLIECRGSMNFQKLSQVHDLVKDITRSGITYEEVGRILTKIHLEDGVIPEWATALSYPLSAIASAIMFFNGSWQDAIMSGTLGIIPGVLRLIALKYEVLFVSGASPLE